MTPATFALLVILLSADSGKLTEARLTEGLRYTECARRAQEAQDIAARSGRRAYAACVPMPAPRERGAI